MTSIIAIVQVTALLTAAILSSICLVSSYKYSIPQPHLRVKLRDPRAIRAGATQGASRRRHRRCQPLLESSPLEATNTRAARLDERFSGNRSRVAHNR